MLSPLCAGGSSETGSATTAPTAEQMWEFKAGNVAAVEEYVGDRALIACEYKIDVEPADGELGENGACIVYHYYRITHSEYEEFPIGRGVLMAVDHETRPIVFPANGKLVYLIRPSIVRRWREILSDDTIVLPLNCSPKRYLNAKRAVDTRRD